MTDELADRSASEVRQLVATREVSAVAVVEACLARVEQHNPALNAVVTLNERAVDDARALDERLGSGEEPGPLCGLPVGIKDVTEVAGVRTTYGSPLYADHVPTEDAEVVRRLRKAGAIILGKTNTPEFAAGGNTWNDVFGRTRNPWDPSKSAGGSTGGGAVGLATGMFPLAQGTDLGGSLRIPASFCGVVGLRPSPGLVPTYPHDYLWDTLNVTGPMARTAADVALALQAIAGRCERTPISQTMAGRDFVAAVEAGVPPGARVAYCPDIAGIGVDPHVEEVCRAAALHLADHGCVVEEIEVDLSYGRDAFLALRGYWFAALMHSRLDRVEEFGINVADNTQVGLALTGQQFGAAEHARARIWHFLRDFFQRYDNLLTPSTAVSPFPVEQNYPETVAGRKMETYVDWIAPTSVLSLAGLPVASVPCGRDPNGLPVGLQVVGGPSGEESVLALAQQIQDVHPIGGPPLAT